MKAQCFSTKVSFVSKNIRFRAKREQLKRFEDFNLKDKSSIWMSFSHVLYSHKDGQASEGSIWVLGYKTRH